jgi:preprotein translocase subunit SecF
VFGGEALKGFAFTMLVGIISGTYSTVFIASAIAILLSQKRRHGVSAAVAASDTAASPRPGKKQRRARAS